MPREAERGAALLTVLLLVAIVSVLAATALEKMRLSTRLASNAGAIEQARAYAYAAETLATSRITNLLSRDPSRVTLAGGWSGTPFGLPFPEGRATARVTDGGNCFNLNSLVGQSGAGLYAANTTTIVQFARLMRLVNVPGQLPESIAAAAADWIDSDDSAIQGGAEDADYLGRQTPYRTAGTLMSDPSELRAVAGVTPDVYAALRPWICTLPYVQRAVLNVNTLTPEQAPLLAMLLPETLGVAGARSLLLRRPALGYSSTVEFWNGLSRTGGITPAPDAMAQTNVTSKWFALRIDVTLGAIELQEQATIDARTLPARLVARQWGEQP